MTNCIACSKPNIKYLGYAVYFKFQAGEILYQRLHLPISGLSEVIGMITCTVFRNIVMESNIVTPAIAIFIKEISIFSKKDKNEYFLFRLLY